MLDRIKNDLKEAMRGGDATAVSTLRMRIAQFQYARIEAGHDLGEPEVLTLLERAVKTRREAIEQFEKGGRADLAAKERAEIAVVQRYLPEAMNPRTSRAPWTRSSGSWGPPARRTSAG